MMDDKIQSPDSREQVHSGRNLPILKTNIGNKYSLLAIMALYAT
jgi:hypothetical protein